MVNGRGLARARQYSKMLRERYEDMRRSSEYVERDLNLDMILASSSPKKEILFVKWALEQAPKAALLDRQSVDSLNGHGARFGRAAKVA